MTNPDKDSKKNDLQTTQSEDVSIASDARQKAGRTVNTANRPRANAAFERWNAERGFGFLTMEDGRRAFCHVSELCTHLNPGRGNEPDLNAKIHVEQVIESDKGLKARKVQCMDCITPAVWELQPDGPELWGAREMKPVCVSKPNEPDYKSTIPHRELWDANEPFRAAREKEKRWQGALTPTFFVEFGEPEKTEATSDNQVILSYPHGTKAVSAYAVYESGHWKMSASGAWKQGESDFSAELVFEGLPGLSIMKQVASTSHPAQLFDAFEYLPAELQTTILDLMRAAIRPAESVAEERWGALTGESHYRKSLDKLRQEILALQAPGEMTHGQASYKSQEEVTGHYGDETWGTGSYMDVTRHYWYLMTGARKKEKIGWSGGPYAGGTTFDIPKPEKDQTTEEIRDEVMNKKQRELKEVIDRVRAVGAIPADSRLYDITPEQWLEKFNLRVDELEKEMEDAWSTEDRAALAKMQSDWAEYEKLTDELKQAREAVEAVSSRANKLGVSLNAASSPDWGNIGTDAADQLRQAINSLRAFIPEAEQIIDAELQAREERKQAEEAERKAEAERRKADAARRLAEAQALAETAPTAQEINPKDLEFAEVGKALADAAIEKLGRVEAIALLDGELNAEYGRGRRQQAIAERLGTPQGRADQFFRYYRARDVNAVLESALTTLQNSAPKQKVAEPMPAPIKTTPASPASMADLMSKFGKKR